MQAVEGPCACEEEHHDEGRKNDVILDLADIRVAKNPLIDHTIYPRSPRQEQSKPQKYGNAG